MTAIVKASVTTDNNATKASKKPLRGKATAKQTFLIKMLGGQDYRGQTLSKKEADQIIKDLLGKSKEEKKVKAKSSPKKTYTKPSKASKEILVSTANAVKSASKNISKAADSLEVAIGNLEALIRK